MAGTGGIAQRWRELSGENNWEGLLDPLDIDLRRYIIHYGARTAAVGDPYNGDKGSNMSRFFRYPPNNFFSEVGLQCGNPFKYTVSSFFYARCEVNLCSWVLISEVWKLVDKYKDEEISITVTGHSLGAALATMTGVDIASNGYNKPSTNNKEGKACPLSSHSHGIC
ncbi:hypothetical protein LWI29_006014 [Acer saccharum]|uniref:Phospholipase A1 n=1 Tax=Acer saccharum TaxID=4024 RepID=A0AA39VFC7_ACESA|nr:hypothetical protein LWI29_006014 [Acer saccharum]